MRRAASAASNDKSQYPPGRGIAMPRPTLFRGYATHTEDTMSDTYDINYQYSPGWFHTHKGLDPVTADIVLRMLHGMGRKCRVRQNATGRLEKVPIATDQPLTLLHLFFKRISDRNGKDADDG